MSEACGNGVGFTACFDAVPMRIVPGVDVFAGKSDSDAHGEPRISE